MASIDCAICKDITYYNSSDTPYLVEWWGHSFNPPDTNGAFGGLTFGYTQPSRTAITSADISSIKPGGEIAIGSMIVQDDYTPPISGTHAYIRWVQGGGLPYLIYEYQPILTTQSGAGAWQEVFYAIGYKPVNTPADTPEIYKNAGTLDEYECYFKLYLNGGGTISTTKTLEISGVTTADQTLRTPGMIWVEGDNIHFICYYGWEAIIKNNGTSYGTGKTPGMIWIPNTVGATYLEYVDSSGVHRRTHNGDILGDWNDQDTSVGSTGHTAGYIWADTYWNLHALKFINYDGTLVRIGNGDIDSNNY